MDGLLERGCIRESRRADDVAESLLSLAAYVPEYHHDIERVYETIWLLEILLSGLPHELYLHPDSVSHVQGDLFLLLATIQGSLDSMRAFIYRSEVVGYRNTWIAMFGQMWSEMGSSINTRFHTFIEFIRLLRDDLRGHHIDYRRLDVTRTFIFALHSRQGLGRALPAILPAAGVLIPYQITQITPEPNHWAENIFETSGRGPVTPMRVSHRRSRCWGPFNNTNREAVFPARSRVLFKLTFHEGFSIKLCMHPLGVPKLLCRDLNYHAQAQSCLPIGELRIKRKGRSCLQILRWSVSRRREWAWVVLYFDEWEKMVLFWCTFMSLKWRCTSMIDRSNYELGGEEVQFRATIRDDRYKHSLSVYRDRRYGVRLEAKAYDGDMRRCPIWTAFGIPPFYLKNQRSITHAISNLVTHICDSSDWLFRRGSRIYIREIHIYVFSSDYHSHHQRVGERGELFMLEFINRDGARNFERIFGPPERSRERIQSRERVERSRERIRSPAISDTSRGR